MEILYEDNHLIAINKRPSEIVQGDKTGDQPLSEKVATYLKEKYNKPGEAFVGVIHRIDRPVSGIVLFAKTSKALARMNELFQNQAVQKTYWAVVKNKPPQPREILIHYLIRNQEKNKSFANTTQKNNSKRAELEYSTLYTFDKYYLLEILPHTGRHHQIRAQLAAIGCPIKGDVKYGDKRSNTDASIHLHAKKIEFIHPVSKEIICITAYPPQEDALWKKATEVCS
ncbi:MAG: RNA pseudouridine synthase [Flavobacteriales bacterium]|nr:RNA pseudouridine synthase [Flavobacteriales bacterium]